MSILSLGGDEIGLLPNVIAFGGISVSGATEGQATSTAAVTGELGPQVHELAGVTVGQATVTAVAGRARGAAGSAAGQATVTAAFSRYGRAAGVAAGAAAVAGAVRRSRPLAAVAVAGGAAVAGHMQPAARTLTGTGQGQAATAGAVGRARRATAAVSGQATAGGALSRDRTLGALAAIGRADTSGASRDRATLRGTTSGLAATAGLARVTRGLAGLPVAGAADVSARVGRSGYAQPGSAEGQATTAGAASIATRFDGSAEGQATTAGAVGRQRTLAGSATGSATVTGAARVETHGIRIPVSVEDEISVSVEVADALAVTVEVVDSLTIPVIADPLPTLRPLIGSATGAAVTGGTLGAVRAMVGSTSGAAVTGGTLGEAESLAGSAEGQATTAGALARAVGMAGDTAGDGAASGTLGAVRAMAGNAEGQASTSGVMRSGELDGSTTGQAATAGALARSVGMAGSTTGQATTAGALTRGVGMEGDALGQLVTTGALTRVRPLAGDATGDAVTTGDIAGSVLALVGDTTGDATTAADTNRVRYLTGVAIEAGEAVRAVTDLGWTPETDVSSALASWLSGAAVNGDVLDLEGETFHLTGNNTVSKNVSLKNGGIYFPAASTTGGALLLFDGVSGVTLEDLTVTGDGYYTGVNAGIQFEGSSNITVQRCAIDLGTKSGIAFEDTTNVRIRKNDIADTVGRALGVDHVGRYLVLLGGGCIGFEIDENYIHHSRDEGIKTGNNWGWGVSDLNIHHNVFYLLGKDALDGTGGMSGSSPETPSRFHHNILRNCDGIDFKVVISADYHLTCKWFDVSDNYCQNIGTFISLTTIDGDQVLTAEPGPKYYADIVPHEITGSGNTIEKTTGYGGTVRFYLNKGSINTTFDDTTYLGAVNNPRTLDETELVSTGACTAEIAPLLNQNNDWGTITTGSAAATQDTSIPFTYGPYSEGTAHEPVIAEGQASTSGAAVRQRPLAGSAAGDATTSGAIGRSVGLAGSTTGQASASGALARAVGMAGDTAGDASTTGAVEAVAGMTPVFRMTARTTVTAAIDGGPNWQAFTSSMFNVTSGSWGTFANNWVGLHPSANNGRVSFAFFTSPSATERYLNSPSSATFTLSGLEGGNYRLVIYTGETYLTAANGRRYDITVNGTLVHDNFDPFVNWGTDYIGAIEIDVTVAPGGSIVAVFGEVNENFNWSAIEVLKL